MILDNSKIKLCYFSSSQNYINAHAQIKSQTERLDDLEV